MQKRWHGVSFEDGAAVIRRLCKAITIFALCLLAHGHMDGQRVDSSETKTLHYQWRLKFQLKDMSCDTAQLVFCSVVRIGRRGVARFESKNNAWVNFDFAPSEYHKGAFWIEGFAYLKENGKYHNLLRGYNHDHILRWPRKQTVRIKLYSIDL